MPGFMESFREGLSEPSGPGAYAVAGKRVVCPHCAGDRFEEGDALLNTAGLTFFGLDWANREAHLLLCVRCSRIEWFGTEPERIPGT